MGSPKVSLPTLMTLVKDNINIVSMIECIVFHTLNQKDKRKYQNEKTCFHGPFFLFYALDATFPDFRLKFRSLSKR